MNLLDEAEAILGFRPESLLPAAAVPGGADALALRVRVTRAEYLGSERVVHGVVEGGPFDGRAVVSRLPPLVAADPAPGAAHPFAVARSALLRFDRATGRAVPGYGAGGRVP
jgi:multiple sugar transport system ATP-binding protein